MRDQEGARLSSLHTSVALHGLISGWCFFLRATTMIIVSYTCAGCRIF